MNGMAQEVKRTFHSTVRIGLMLTRRFGLTPSRYELMSAIKSERQVWFSQRTLRDLLGIAASTLSKMVHALVQRGFLRSRRDPDDGRCCQLRLTLFGKRALGCTFRCFVKSGFADYVFGRGLTDSFDGDISSDQERATALGDMRETLRITRTNFGNEATFRYEELRQPAPRGLHARISRHPHLRWVWENYELPILELMQAVAA
jgi:DNA-binding MarR family transcriptional regulator